MDACNLKGSILKTVKHVQSGQKHFIKQLTPQSLSTALSLNLKKATQDWGSALKNITSTWWGDPNLASQSWFSYSSDPL